jgi:hypothetical protein
MSDRTGAPVRVTEPRRATPQLLEIVTVAVGVIASVAMVAVIVRIVPPYLEEQAMPGALFLIAAPLLVVVAVDLWSPLRRTGMWLVGATASLGAALVYVVSLARDLPDERPAWWDAWSLAGLVLVAAYLLAMTVWFAAHRATTRSERAVIDRPARRRQWKHHRNPPASSTA